MSTMPGQHRRILRGVAALAILAALAIGAPVTLARVAGWPLPRSMPGWDALSQPIADEIFVKAIAAICWLAWAQLMVCLVAEVIACLRGRTTPRLPASQASQRLAGWLVASFMALPIQSPLPATAASLPAPVTRSAVAPAPLAVTPAVPASAAAETTTHRGTVPTPAQEPECIVGPRDTLWAIADRHLGNPRRWPEIFELNRGRLQHDGAALSNPRHITKGWVLRLPADGVAPSARAAQSVVVAPGDSLSGLARRHLGDAHRWPEVFELNKGKPQPDGRSLQDPDLIRPHWVLRLSVDAPPREPAPVPASAPPAVAALPASPPPTSPGSEAAGEQALPTTPRSEAQPAPEPPASAGGRTGTDPAQPLAVLGTGLAAVGVVVTLDRLRRARSRRSLPGRPPAVPNPNLADSELGIRTNAGQHGADVDRLDVSLRALGAALANQPDRPRPPVIAVQIAGDAIEFLLAAPCPAAPDGFTATDDGWTWRISTADLDTLRSSAGRVAPLPALVTLGTGVGGTVLVDLETAGVMAIDGDPGEARRLLHQFVLELGTSTWADHLDVVVIGERFTGIETLPRVRHATSAAAVIDELEPAAAALRTALGNRPTTFAARTTGDGGDGWIPTLIICTETPDDQTAARLATLAADGGTGLGVVVAGALPGARWTLRCKDGTIQTVPLGLRLHRAGLTEETLEAADQLLAEEAEPAGDEPAAASDADQVAAGPLPPEMDRVPSGIDRVPSGIDRVPPDTDRVPPDMDRVVVLPAPAPADEPDDEPFEEAPFEVEVRLLGPVDVIGSDQPIEGGRPLDLIAYLALHPEGADGDRLRTVLWPPDRPAPAAKTFANVISLTRGLIGARHFPQANSEIYRLAGTVTTDVARFQRLVAHAEHHSSTRAIELLRTALKLVRGQPFAATQGFHWAQPEGHPARIQALVVDNAHRMVELCLAAADPSGADWAARQGLLASPGNEILYRDRMLAADAAGNPAGVHAAMAELCDVLETDDLTDRVHPDTLALYEELTSKGAKRSTA
ncbi:MAG: BTAD domain-containing putative transcriptional regulator [Actinomycetota bacterium]